MPHPLMQTLKVTNYIILLSKKHTLVCKKITTFC